MPKGVAALPAYLASLFVTSLAIGVFPLIMWLVNGNPISLIGAFGLRNLLINGLFMQQVFPESLKFNGVYWTLVYEVAFYLFYPLLLLSIRGLGLVAMAIVLLGAEIALAISPTSIPLFFLNRYFEWYLG